MSVSKISASIINKKESEEEATMAVKWERKMEVEVIRGDEEE